MSKDGGQGKGGRGANQNTEESDRFAVPSKAAQRRAAQSARDETPTGF